jgi:hypothetical protein
MLSNRRIDSQTLNDIRSLLQAVWVDQREDDADFRRNKLLQSATSPLNPKDEVPTFSLSGEGPTPSFGWDFMGDEPKPLFYDDEKGKALTKLALEGDRDADWVLCSVAAGYLRTYTMLPPHLRGYVVNRLSRPPAEVQPRRRGRKKNTNFRRNEAIAMAIELLNGRGFHATRNEATEGECACSIVATVLSQCFEIELSEHAIAKIWTQHERRRGRRFVRPPRWQARLPFGAARMSRSSSL